jgi:hypothetical protein
MEPTTTPADAPAPAAATAAFGTVTLLTAFDIGTTFLADPAFAWTPAARWRVPRQPADFPFDIQPGFRCPILLDLDPAGAALRNALADLAPTCEVNSATCCFFLEGFAFLRVRARLRVPAARFKEAFDKWEEERQPGCAEPAAYEPLQAVLVDARDRYVAMAEEAGLKAVLARTRRLIDWIYPVFFTEGGEWVYPPNQLAAPVRYDDSEVLAAWRGVHVRLASRQEPGLQAAHKAEQQAAVEILVAFAALAWQALHGVDRYLGEYLVQLQPRPGGPQPVAPGQGEDMHDVRLFSHRVLETARPRHWTIRGAFLTLLENLGKAWDTTESSASIRSKTDLVTLYHEKREAQRKELEARQEALRKDAEATRNQRRDNKFKVIGFILAVVSSVSAIASVFSLIDKDYPGWGWWGVSRAAIALGLSSLLGILAGIYLFRVAVDTSPRQ